MYVNKPHRKSGYDYNQSGAYFVTICIKDRKCLFGRIENEQLIHNHLGVIANECLEEIPKHFEEVELGEYIVMPNHIHCVILITTDNSENSSIKIMSSTPKRRYEKLPIIVANYKAAVTRRINKEVSDNDFGWQISFYDHIIRDDFGLGNIYNYIRNNPLTWNKDLENTEFYSVFSVEERRKKSKEFYQTLCKKSK